MQKAYSEKSAVIGIVVIGLLLALLLVAGLGAFGFLFMARSEPLVATVAQDQMVTSIAPLSAYPPSPNVAVDPAVANAARTDPQTRRQAIDEVAREMLLSTVIDDATNVAFSDAVVKYDEAKPSSATASGAYTTEGEKNEWQAALTWNPEALKWQIDSLMIDGVEIELPVQPETTPSE